MSQEEKKDKVIATTTTIVTMIILFIFMFFCGLSYTYPPPAPRLELLIELTMEGGGGGGGGNMSSTTHKNSAGSAENIVTSHDVNIPSIPRSTRKQANAVSNEPVEDLTPKANPNAAYRPGMGGGRGGGSSTGQGSGVGSGFGSGEGSGSGGGTGSGTGSGIGYGTGHRANTYMPSLAISEPGKVYVQVHVNADGTVVDAQIIANSKYPTSITNSKIREDCLKKAMTARYIKGKEEFRIIVFSL